MAPQYRRHPTAHSRARQCPAPGKGPAAGSSSAATSCWLNRHRDSKRMRQASCILDLRKQYRKSRVYVTEERTPAVLLLGVPFGVQRLLQRQESPCPVLSQASRAWPCGRSRARAQCEGPRLRQASTTGHSVSDPHVMTLPRGRVPQKDEEKASLSCSLQGHQARIPSQEEAWAPASPPRVLATQRAGGRGSLPKEHHGLIPLTISLQPAQGD